MLKEGFYMVQLADETQNQVLGRLYYLILNEDDISVTLSTNQFELQASGYNFTVSLLELLRKLPHHSKICITHDLIAKQNDSVTLLKLEENISLVFLESIQDYSVQFNLACSIDGITYQSQSIEDFSIAMAELNRKINVNLQMCFNCKFADFKSNGCEDLRLGWYCLRDIGIGNNKKWFEVEDNFGQALPGMSAFYWCPKFCFEDNKAY